MAINDQEMKQAHQLIDLIDLTESSRRRLDTWLKNRYPAATQPRKTLDNMFSSRGILPIPSAPSTKLYKR